MCRVPKLDLSTTAPSSAATSRTTIANPYATEAVVGAISEQGAIGQHAEKKQTEVAGGSSEEPARKLAQGAEKKQGVPLQVAPFVKQEISFLLVSHEAVAMTPSPPEPAGGESTERKGGFPRDAPRPPPERDTPPPAGSSDLSGIPRGAPLLRSPPAGSSHSPHTSTLKFECEYNCGFTDVYDEVSVHEFTCARCPAAQSPQCFGYSPEGIDAAEVGAHDSERVVLSEAFSSLRPKQLMHIYV